MPKILSILTVLLIVLAFVLRAVIPKNLLLPGGWPLGSHWYPTGWVAFWFSLIVATVTGLIAIIKVVWRSEAIR